MKQMKHDLSPEIPKYFCEKCQYKTNNKKDYTKHLGTSKHVNETNETHETNKICPNINHTCDCGLKFNSRTTLWRHKKKNNCIKHSTSKTDLDTCNADLEEEDLEPSSKDIIKMMKMQMIENQEIRNLIIELLKKETISNNINNNNNTINNNNCNNQSFNLNFFLNEQCKDALNIDEFVDSIKMNLSDLENFAHLGYADGVSNIFAKGIKELGVHLRPIHCSDTKRETLYIKNNDEWIKETDDKPLITKAIKKVAFKNIKQINEWVKENPACKDPRTKKYDQYNKIVMNAMSGVTEEEQKNNIEKIVKNVTKSVAIEKYAIQ
jgi:hypothetical protein